MSRGKRWSTSVMAAAFSLVGGVAAAAPADIWLTPIDPFNLHERNPRATPDMLEMFRPGAPWGNAAAHVKVLKTATKFVLLSSDAMLSALVQGLKDRRIDYGLETGLLSRSPRCGQGVEGFNAAGGDVELAKKIQRVGGRLSDLSMDEPLWFAHHYGGPNACHYAIEEVARQVAIEVAALKRIFPGMQLGDIEPVGVTDSPNWVDDIMRWVAAYRAATGEPLGFLHADVNWNGPWREQVRELRRRLHAAGIPFGIIYIGNPADQTGEAAVRHAQERIVEVSSDPSLAPDQVIFQSWLRHPEHNLPETTPGTMTYLVDRYLAAPTLLTANVQGRSVIGKLSDSAGRPVAGAPVQVIAVDNGKGAISNLRTLSGTVPPGAANAVFGLRINRECDCSGTADVAIGTLGYREQGAGSAIERTLGAVPEATAGGRIVAAKGHPVSRNTAQFPVTPGAAYTVSVAMQVSRESAGSGYVGIIFLDRQGKGVKRERLPFEPTTKQVGQSVTDATGGFSVQLGADMLQSHPGFDVRFPGSDGYRLSWTFLP